MQRKTQRASRWRQLFGLIAVLTALLPPPVSASNDTVSCDGAMEGNLRIQNGDMINAGYDFMLVGEHPALSVNVSGTIRIFEDCGTITILLAPTTYTVPKNSSAWVPSADQNGKLVYQGSAKASCTGHAIKGATFTASFAWSNGSCARGIARFHYKGDNSEGSWGQPVVVSDRGECLSAPCECQ